MSRTAMALKFQMSRLLEIENNNDDDDAEDEDDAKSKMNLCFTSEIRNCLDLFSRPMALKTCSGG